MTPRRPIAVWIAQIILVVLIVILCGVTGYTIFHFIVVASRPEISWVPFVFQVVRTLGWIVSLIALFVVAFWGLQKRESYGRWLSLGILLSYWGVCIYAAFHPTPGPLPTFDIDYSNPGERSGALIAAVMWNSGFFILLFELVFGKSVMRFFGKADVSKPADSGTIV